MYYLYHISDSKDLSTGYVGVTNNPEATWQRHLRSDFTIGRHIRKMNWTYEDNYAILMTGTAKMCFEMEERLRPKPYIGLNEASGGKGGHTVYTQERGKKISDALKGKPKSPEHIAKMKETLRDGRRSGSKNGRAKRKVVVSPDGIEYIVEGNWYAFCEDHNILWSVLWKYRGEVVPPVNEKKFRPKDKGHREARDNTNGWWLRLF